MTSVSNEQMTVFFNKLKTNDCRITSSDEHIKESLIYYFALKNLTEHYGLEGIAIKCYPKLMGKVCLPFSILSDEGIVCGCEGDVNNTVSMKILYELSGMPTHNTDLLYPDPSLNTILFSHCGSGAFSLAKNNSDIHLGPVRLSNTGVCSLFPARTGKVTLINLVGRKGSFRMSVITGDAVECGMEFPGNPLKIRFERNVDDINRMIAIEGIGHHWIGGYGDMAKELDCFCSFNSIRYIQL